MLPCWLYFLIQVKFTQTCSYRFIRREKEIAETRFEVAQVESLRYRQRVELLERELQELQDSLNAEREKVQVRALSVDRGEASFWIKGRVKSH